MGHAHMEVKSCSSRQTAENLLLASFWLIKYDMHVMAVAVIS